MKAVILAGGLGSRIAEETHLRPKPMINIGGKPILWHIMNKFSFHGIRDFIICLGFKGEVIKEYFLNFSAYNSDFSINTNTMEINFLVKNRDEWNVTLVDTGISSNTAERIKRIKKYVGKETFYLTYGDGLTDQNLSETANFHFQNHRLVTLTAVPAPARYGSVLLNDNLVSIFSEKITSNNSLINGGYFLVEYEIFDLLSKFSNPSWENNVLPLLAKNGDLAAYKHLGFWYAMDTIRDKEYLEHLLEKGLAKWLN